MSPTTTAPRRTGAVDANVDAFLGRAEQGTPMAYAQDPQGSMAYFGDAPAGSVGNVEQFLGRADDGEPMAYLEEPQAGNVEQFLSRADDGQPMAYALDPVE